MRESFTWGPLYYWNNSSCWWQLWGPAELFSLLFWTCSTRVVWLHNLYPRALPAGTASIASRQLALLCCRCWQRWRVPRKVPLCHSPIGPAVNYHNLSAEDRENNWHHSVSFSAIYLSVVTFSRYITLEWQADILTILKRCGVSETSWLNLDSWDPAILPGSLFFI